MDNQVHVFNCDSPAVVLCPNKDAKLLAVGHLDGGVSIYDLQDKSEEASPDPNVTFQGHTSEIITIEWDSSGTILASGGKDTRIILWDCVSELGIIKLTGHKGPITRVRFWKNSQYLVSSSTDTTMRIWELATNNCIHTIAGNGQIWDFGIWGNYIFECESNIRLLSITEGSDDIFTNEEIGILTRSSVDRVKMVELVEEKYLVVAGARSREIDIFQLNSDSMAEKKKRKRIKKDSTVADKLILKDLVTRLASQHVSEGKLRSLDAYLERASGDLKILCCLPSNQVEVVTCNPRNILTKKDINAFNNSKTNELHGFDGHRKIVRCVDFSSDRTAIISGSGDAFKIWHRSSLSCVLTILHDFAAVCCKFCPGDRHFVAGTTCGKIVLGEISTGSILQVEECGDDTVWGIQIFPNLTGFIASNGHTLKFYNFSMSDGILRFDFQRLLCVDETILCMQISPNMKTVAVGLLDSTMKVYYMDTLKFHLSLYGHKLPVVSIDISVDSQLLVSCAGDKTVKVWGLDFGDCHASMRHADGLVGVAFIENTHHVVSVGRDTINFYDVDRHKRIQTIKAHVEGGSTCMALSGLFVVTSGRDQTLRLFNRTDEILVLDDEREREREEELQKEATVENPKLPSLQTAESERGADKLIEALDVFGNKCADASLILQAYGAKTYNDFMLKVLTGIKASELEHSIMLLPVSYVHQMIPALCQVLEDYPLITELAIRCLNSLVTFHFSSLRIADKHLLSRISVLAKQRASQLKDQIGFNVAALKFLQDSKVGKSYAIEYNNAIASRKRKKKKADALIKRSLLSVAQ